MVVVRNRGFAQLHELRRIHPTEADYAFSFGRFFSMFTLPARGLYSKSRHRPGRCHSRVCNLGTSGLPTSTLRPTSSFTSISGALQVFCHSLSCRRESYRARCHSVCVLSPASCTPDNDGPGGKERLPSHMGPRRFPAAQADARQLNS